MKTALIAFVCMAGCTTQVDVPTVPEAQAALTDNAELFRHILATRGEDPEQTLLPGKPLPVYLVDVAELASFDGKKDLLRPSRERFFPLYGRAGTALGSITLERSGERWTMVRAGAPNLTRALVAARAELPAGADEVGLVRILPLGMDFLAARRGRELALLPLYDHDELGIRARTIQPAAALLAQLAPEARRTMQR